MKAAIAASLLSFLSVASAVPTPGVLQPEVISQYTVSTGAINFNTPTGKVFKDGKSSDITTLVTFNVPSSLSGHTCTFRFSLPSNAVLSGSKKFDVFTSQAPATTSTKTWPHGNLRDQYQGRFQAVSPGEAKAGADGITTATTFPCPAGRLLAGEIVGVGDTDHIEWAKGQGPFLSFN
jgi:hypothetical protein